MWAQYWVVSERSYLRSILAHMTAGSFDSSDVDSTYYFLMRGEIDRPFTSYGTELITHLSWYREAGGRLRQFNCQSNRLVDRRPFTSSSYGTERTHILLY